jgi:hypothetical protein
VTRPAFYDRIARKWHAVTGSRGGALKRLVLNDLLWGSEDVFASPEVFRAEPGLRGAGGVPAAMVLDCVRPP